MSVYFRTPAKTSFEIAEASFPDYPVSGPVAVAAL